MIIRERIRTTLLQAAGIVAGAFLIIHDKIKTTLLQVAGIILAFLLLVRQWFIDKWEDIKTTVIDAWTEIETFLTEIDLLQIGKDAIQGLLDGMKEAWAGIKEWIGSRIDDLPQWIKDALGITSPPDWAIKMGEDIVAGLQAGLDLSGLQDRVAGAVNVNAFAGAGGLVSPTVVFAQGAFAGAFPGVRDGRDAGSVMSEVQRMVEDGYLRAQVPGGVSG